LKKKSVTLLRTFACAAMLGALFATPAGAADWKTVKLGLPEAHLNGISCPAANLCVAVGTNSTFAVSTTPAGEAADWVTTSRPQLGRGDGDLRGVECPSPALCFAIESSGAILTTTRPLSGASAWTTLQIPGAEGLFDISCPRASRCVAVGDGGLVVTSSNPTAGSTAWTVGRIAPTVPLFRVACASGALSCVATAGTALVSTTDLTAEAAGWELEGETAGSPLNGVDCPSESFCAIGGAGNALTTTNPTGPLAGWTAAPVPTGFQLLGIDCRYAGRCVATSDNGEVFASSVPQSWVRGRFSGERPGGLYDVSCPSEELCVAVGETAQVASSTNPFAIPPGPGPGAGLPARPRTVVFGKHNRRLRLKGNKEKAGIRFHFTANGKYTGFQCKLDRGPFRRCKDPKSYALALGRHLFKVRAIGPGGVDRSPGKIRVRVIKAQTRQRDPRHRPGSV
jgi:hypothetical protein